MRKKFDFGGWATKYNVKCADGLTIQPGAFSDCDGKVVPLVWNHNHDDPSRVLGHAVLRSKKDGIYAECSFNNTQKAKDAKEAVSHGDVSTLSIWANNLSRAYSDVVHGVIREVSLVLAGANPGAMIESTMAHGMSMDESDDEAIIYSGENLEFLHSDEGGRKNPSEEPQDDEGETQKKKSKNGDNVAEIYENMTDEQKLAVAAIVQTVLEEDDKSDDEGGKGSMKHNVFEQDGGEGVGIRQSYLSHSDVSVIMQNAKACGSFRQAFSNYIEDNEIDLIHGLDTTGMIGESGKTQDYFVKDPTMLFPEAKTVSPIPEFISRDMTWVQEIMGRVTRSPFSRVKSLLANITEEEARARGYIKGNQKKTEVIGLLKRTTDPQTIYKLQKIDRDDIIDITDFNVIEWIRGEMRMMLDEECAVSVLIGDGRESGDENKVSADHVRPICEDVPLYNIKSEVKHDGTDKGRASEMIDQAVRARKGYKGSGNPILFTTEDILTEMLLLKNNNGERLYKTEAELATTMRVSKIVTVEPMEGRQVDDKDLLGIIVNPVDYRVGADKGGEVNWFDDFDIDFNKYSYLIETRFSGALTKPFSAITLLDGGKVTP